MTNEIMSAGTGPGGRGHGLRVRLATALAVVLTALAAIPAWAAPAAAATAGGCRGYTSPDRFGLQIDPCLWTQGQVSTHGQDEVLMNSTFSIKGMAPGPVAWGCYVYESINGGAWQQYKQIGCAPGATSSFIVSFPDTVPGMGARFYVAVGYSWNGTWYDWVETPVVYAP